MNLADFYEIADGVITYSRNSASHFAKGVAGDFNPLHDPDSRRFCIPGDLLFATTLDLVGVYQQMSFDFINMVDASQSVKLESDTESLLMRGLEGREYLQVSKSGQCCDDRKSVAVLVDAYVQFSGRTFPYLLVELMREKNAMINPARPLVIYKSMQLSLEDLRFQSVQLRFSDSQFSVEGKKGEVALNFELLDGERCIGRGAKKMLLGGLRAYDEVVMGALVAEYNAIKTAYRRTAESEAEISS